MTIEMKKTKVKMDKPIYFGMPILDISKTLMYEFWHDYIKPKYRNRAKLCYRDTDSFVVYIMTEDFYRDIAADVERWFDTSNVDENDERPLPIGINKTAPGLFKDELGGKIMIEFCGVRAKTWAYLLHDDTKHKKAKGTKKSVIKRGLIFKNYKDCLFNYKIILKSQQVFRSDDRNVYTVEYNKILLSSDDAKRLQTFDRMKTYPHGANAFKVCESEMIIARDLFVENYADRPFYDEIVLQSQI